MISPERAAKVKKSNDEDLLRRKLELSSGFIEGELINGKRKIRIDNDGSIFSIYDKWHSRFDVILECWGELYKELIEAGWKPTLVIHKKDHWLTGKEHYLEITFEAKN